jgi:hypothetical protein
MIDNLIKLPGGVGDRAPSDQIDPIQLSTGIQIEMEHTNDPEIAKEIEAKIQEYQGIVIRSRFKIDKKGGSFFSSNPLSLIKTSIVALIFFGSLHSFEESDNLLKGSYSEHLMPLDVGFTSN